MLEIKDLYWLAGFLEGEGYFGISEQGDSKIPRIQCNSTDRDVLVKASILMLKMNRTTLTRAATTQYKAVYQFSVNGDLAISWMMTLYSLMGTRRKEKIKVSIQTWKDYNPYLSNCPRCNTPYKYTKYKAGPRAGELIRRCFVCNTRARKARVARLREATNG